MYLCCSVKTVELHFVIAGVVNSTCVSTMVSDYTLDLMIGLLYSLALVELDFVWSWSVDNCG